MRRSRNTCLPLVETHSRLVFDPKLTRFHSKGRAHWMFCWLILLFTAEAHDLPVSIKGLTEPNHGSDPAGMDTTAEETDGGFILRGSKTWITNAPVA